MNSSGGGGSSGKLPLPKKLFGMMSGVLQLTDVVTVLDVTVVVTPVAVTVAELLSVEQVLKELPLTTAVIVTTTGVAAAPSVGIVQVTVPEAFEQVPAVVVTVEKVTPPVVPPVGKMSVTITFERLPAPGTPPVPGLETVSV
jgi:hypothetical protein